MWTLPASASIRMVLRLHRRKRCSPTPTRSGTKLCSAPGQYRPGTASGQHVLAHELTHVVQQRHGPVSGTPTGDGIALSDPSDSFERAAEANADRILSGAPSNTLASASVSGGSSVQRQAPEEEEETAQAMRVQREAPPEEEEKEPRT